MRLFGHPVHPIVVSFPVALLSLTPFCDAAAWLGVATDLAKVAHYLELAGLVGAGLAVVTGALDFYAMKEPSDELTRVALAHAAFAIATLSIFGLAFALRGEPSATPPLASIGLELIGAVVLAATGWLGGHLVFRFGLGVSRSSRTP